MHVVLAVNGSRMAAVFGTKQARPFKSKKSAELAARRYEKRHPTMSTLVMEINPEEEAVL